MRAAYIVFFYTEEDVAFSEITWGNRKNFLPEWTKCRIEIAVLTTEIMDYDKATALSKLYGTRLKNLKKLVKHAIDLGLNDLPFLWKLLEKFIR